MLSQLSEHPGQALEFWHIKQAYAYVGSWADFVGIYLLFKGMSRVWD